MINSWNSKAPLDGILTAGDNNFLGTQATMDASVGQYYSKYMFPYNGSYAPPPNARNRFYPIPGEQDWGDVCGSGSDLNPYLTYMPVLNATYYSVVFENVHFFMIDSDCNEPYGTTATSVQGKWVQKELILSTSPWKVVVLHHPPFSSGKKGSTRRSQWPFKAWGAHAVVSAHDYDYERIVMDGGFPFFLWFVFVFFTFFFFFFFFRVVK